MRPLGSSGPWQSGQVTSRSSVILAPNPSWMTLDGTNSWLLLEPGSHEAIVIDPGPDDPEHLDRLVQEADDRDARIAQILLTHGHHDHADGAPGLHARTGAPVRALDPRHRLGSEGLVDGDVIEVGGLQLEILATPGHTADSLTFLLPADKALLTGDTILGRGTAVIAHPDGHLGSYLDSLAQLARAARATKASWVLPGHGPAAPDPVRLIDGYVAHREERLATVADALARGVTDLDDLLVEAYPDVPEPLRWAARLSLAAQVEHLTGRAPGAAGG